jgi:hypothetical protein
MRDERKPNVFKIIGVQATLIRVRMRGKSDREKEIVYAAPV